MKALQNSYKSYFPNLTERGQLQRSDFKTQNDADYPNYNESRLVNFKQLCTLEAEHTIN